jgi:hypothetical protein
MYVRVNSILTLFLGLIFALGALSIVYLCMEIEEENDKVDSTISTITDATVTDTTYIEITF